MKCKSKCIPLLILWIMTAAIGRSEETYAIKLSHPAKVGERYHVRIHGSNTEQMLVSLGRKTNARSNTVIVELEGEIKVLETDQRGHRTKYACTVGTCVTDTGRGKMKLFEKGDVIVTSAVNGKKDFSLNETNVSREAAAALGIVLSVYTGGHDDDDIFGTKEPKRIGDAWAINSKAAIQN